jgi:hypothetical protein
LKHTKTFQLAKPKNKKYLKQKFLML